MGVEVLTAVMGAYLLQFGMPNKHFTAVML